MPCARARHNRNFPLEIPHPPSGPDRTSPGPSRNPAAGAPDAGWRAQSQPDTKPPPWACDRFAPVRCSGPRTRGRVGLCEFSMILAAERNARPSWVVTAAAAELGRLVAARQAPAARLAAAARAAARATGGAGAGTSRRWVVEAGWPPVRHRRATQVQWAPVRHPVRKVHAPATTVTVTATDADAALMDLIYDASVTNCSGGIDAVTSTISLPEQTRRTPAGSAARTTMETNRRTVHCPIGVRERGSTTP